MVNYNDTYSDTEKILKQQEKMSYWQAFTHRGSKLADTLIMTETYG